MCPYSSILCPMNPYYSSPVFSYTSANSPFKWQACYLNLCLLLVRSVVWRIMGTFCPTDEPMGTHLLSRWFSCHILEAWRLRRHVSPKRHLTFNRLQGVSTRRQTFHNLNSYTSNFLTLQPINSRSEAYNGAGNRRAWMLWLRQKYLSLPGSRFPV